MAEDESSLDSANEKDKKEKIRSYTWSKVIKKTLNN